MNKCVDLSLVLDSNLETVSMALNGLFSEPGPLTEVKNHYLIDIKEKMQKKDDNEVILLSGEFFKSIKTMDIRLTEINYKQTKLDFSIEKQSGKLLLGMMLFLEFFFAFLFGMIFADMHFSLPSVVVFLIAFAITSAIFSFLPIIAVKSYKDATYRDRFNKVFLPRINSYIEIVNRNKKQIF